VRLLLALFVLLALLVPVARRIVGGYRLVAREWASPSATDAAPTVRMRIGKRIVDTAFRGR
jgi:hypothetical protein